MIDPLKNFKNPWEADGEYAQNFLNIDRILDRGDVLKLQGQENESEISMPDTLSDGHLYHADSGFYISSLSNKNDLVYIYSNKNKSPRILKYDGKSIDIQTLENLAITAYGESLGEAGPKNQDEAFSIASSIVNKHQIQMQRNSKRDINDTLTEMRNNLSYLNYGSDFQASGFFRITSRQDRNNYPYMRVVLVASINALSKGLDKSKGAIGWHGDDLTIEGSPAYNFFYKKGWKYSNVQHDIWNQGSFKNSENSYTWMTTAAYTKNLVFYKMNPEYAEKNGLLLDGYPK